ncbi:hypothetical protein QAD02_002296 [Eretmocerus hayati]|uniref:Uncharacterized protein n=1 Tax=Eretmocerus hayati TaxID=131215 RepID=A0ACC2NLD7_9HYME|nr:hypothetical protein QAD02_002296 [Eretmocerus hayati]
MGDQQLDDNTEHKRRILSSIFTLDNGGCKKVLIGLECESFENMVYEPTLRLIHVDFKGIQFRKSQWLKFKKGDFGEIHRFMQGYMDLIDKTIYDETWSLRFTSVNRQIVIEMETSGMVLDIPRRLNSDRIILDETEFERLLELTGIIEYKFSYLSKISKVISKILEIAIGRLFDYIIGVNGSDAEVFEKRAHPWIIERIVDDAFFYFILARMRSESGDCICKNKLKMIFYEILDRRTLKIIEMLNIRLRSVIGV